MTNTETTRTIVGIVGNVISLFLFLSPVPTFYKICKAKNVQSFKPDPYLATVFNCAMWVFYGMPFVHADSLLVVTINSAGTVIQLCYIITYLIYANWPKRRKVIIIFVAEFIVLCVLVLITLLALHGTSSRSMLIGIVAIILNIGMYAAPLTVMQRVIKTKSVKFMPFYLSLGNLGNGIIWLIYALLKIDPYILIPNALGTVSGIGQLILYATYYRTTKWEDTDSNPHEIQLQRTASASQA